MKTRSYDCEDYFVDVEIGQTGPFKTCYRHRLNQAVGMMRSGGADIHQGQ